MVLPISSLANMEMALYGGCGQNANAPSFMNGYMATNNYMNQYSMMNPAFNGYGSVYGNYNPTFGQNIPQGYGAYAQQPTAQNSVFQGLSDTEKQALVDDYAKSLTPSEGFMGCLAGNAVFAAISNPRLIAHPINTFRATFSAKNATNKFFNTLKKDANFIKLWENPENSNILREAWLQHNKAVARLEDKFGAFRRGYKAIDNGAAKGLIEQEIKALEAALKSGNMEKITYQTARLQHAYSANGGFISRGWNKVKGLFTEVKPASVIGKLDDTQGIKGRVEELAKTCGTLNPEGKLAATATTKTRYIDMIKRGGGVKGGLFFMGIEFLMAALLEKKFTKAFDADKENAKNGIKTNYGWTQIGQTTVKAAGNAVGWTLGEAAGMWAFAKWGAKLGSKVHPLLGTLIGGAVGLVGGGLGMWLAGKGTKAIVGDDVANKIEAKNLAQSQEGQVQLLQNTIQRIESGEKVSAQAQMAIQKMMTQMA
ncbi:hypothetical protein IJ384_02045 [bacterium]|nr:hypothetical protein [bacterium]